MTTRGPLYTHEAHKVSGTYNPHLESFYGLSYGTDGCSTQGGTQSYELIPVKTIGSSPRYEYYSDVGIPANAGGDALWFTYLTMKTFKQRSWNSFDNSGTVAKIVVDAPCRSGWTYIYDNATYITDGSNLVYGPNEGVAVCPRYPDSSNPYRLSAAIDVVAHEWGHGVVYHSANWAYSGSGQEYHEGFADVVGYMTEWAQQSAGSGAEKAEWRYSEDVLLYPSTETPVRRVDQDDGIGGYSLHKDDASSTAHGRGNRLPTALRLMAVGGYNPVCARLPGLSGCNANVTSIGVDKAGRILFKVLTSYATSSSGWNDFGELGKTAAFALYSNCIVDYGADIEQDAVIKAFTAVGYPPTTTLRICKNPL